MTPPMHALIRQWFHWGPWHSSAGRSEAAVFALLVVSYLVPVWWYTFIPTGDGPLHVASAVLWSELEREGSRAADFFELRPCQVPNLTSQLLLGLLVRFVPPLVAEKLLVSLYIAGFATAFRYALGAFPSHATSLASLALVFVYHGAFWMGVYNYSLSLALFWVVVGFCLRHRDEFTRRDAAALAVLLATVYMTHLVGWLLSCAAAFWFVCVWRRARPAIWIRIAAAMAPSAVLAGWYFQQTDFFGNAGAPSLVGKWLVRTWTGHGDTAIQRLGAVDTDLFGRYGTSVLPLGLLALLFLEALIVARVAAAIRRDGPRARNESSWPVWVFAAALCLLHCLLPNEVGEHGGQVAARLPMLPPLLAAGAAGLPCARLSRRGLLAAMHALVLLNLALVALFFDEANRAINEFVSGVHAVGRNHTVVRLFRTGVPRHLVHGSGYYALGNGNVPLDNFQGRNGPFWIKFRDGVKEYSGDLRYDAHRSAVDYVLMWDDQRSEIPELEGCVEVFRKARLRVFSNQDHEAVPRR